MQSWQGKSVWIWYLDKCENGDVDSIVNKARSANIDALIIKAHDGASWWEQFYPQLVDKLHAAGIKVGAWGYCYGDHWQAEAELAIQALEMGADFYVADVEAEFEKASMVTVATRLMSAIRVGAKGRPVGFTSFGIPNYHPSFPWKSFAALSDFVMPQVYWGDFGMVASTATRMAVSQCNALGIPVVPEGQSYGSVTPIEMGNFVQACEGCAGVSWWSWQHATDLMWAAISGSNIAVKEVIPTLKFGDTGETVKTLQAQLNDVLGTHIAVDGQYGNGMFAAVKSFQQLNRLSVDGIAGPSTLEALAAKVKASQPVEAAQTFAKEQALALLVNAEADLAKAKTLINSL